MSTPFLKPWCYVVLALIGRNGPPRTTGCAALAEWLTLPTPLPRIQNEANVRLLAGGMVPDSDLAASLLAVRAELDEVEALLDETEAGLDPDADRPGTCASPSASAGASSPATGHGCATSSASSALCRLARSPPE